MTWSAPIDRTNSTFVVLQTPVTSAPDALASCTANGLEGGVTGDGHGRGLLEAEVRRLGREPVRSGARVLGEGAVAGAEHLVTRVAPGRVGADRLHAPGDIP